MYYRLPYVVSYVCISRSWWMIPEKMKFISFVRLFVLLTIHLLPRQNIEIEYHQLKERLWKLSPTPMWIIGFQNHFRWYFLSIWCFLRIQLNIRILWQINHQIKRLGVQYLTWEFSSIVCIWRKRFCKLYNGRQKLMKRVTRLSEEEFHTGRSFSPK